MMKSLKIGSKKLGQGLRRKNGGGPETVIDPQGESPEATAARGVKSFCESSGHSNSGDEVLYLPPIVDAAESSPAAAAECARLIRKYLKRDYWTKPSYQYNAIMIIRILADNPGETFTRNFDQKFTDVAKELLRNGRDPSVRQMLMETLDSFENTKAYDEGLTMIIEMWKKEKEKAQKQYGSRQPPAPMPRSMNAPPHDPHTQNYFARSHTNRRLPSPVELASRLEEARASANLLQQVVTSTPPGEVLNNDLIKEFADRCTSASRSTQMYMTAENPSPDNDTMESLIDTNEQLQASLSLHQRAMLNARKHAGIGVMGSETSSQVDGTGSSRRPSPNPGDYDPPPMPPPKHGNGKGKEKENAIAGPSRSHTPAAEEDDPFKDPQADGSAAGVSGSKASSGAPNDGPRLGFEPHHPGFSASPSYLNRQESALDHETMHGGGGAASAASATGASSGRPSRAETDEELYEATPPKNKQTVYRY